MLIAFTSEGYLRRVIYVLSNRNRLAVFKCFLHGFQLILENEIVGRCFGPYFHDRLSLGAERGDERGGRSELANRPESLVRRLDPCPDVIEALEVSTPNKGRRGEGCREGEDERDEG